MATPRPQTTRGNGGLGAHPSASRMLYNPPCAGDGMRVMRSQIRLPRFSPCARRRAVRRHGGIGTPGPAPELPESLRGKSPRAYPSRRTAPRRACLRATCTPQQSQGAAKKDQAGNLSGS